VRVLIIGGTGLTGPHVARRLVQLGHELALFHRGTSDVELPPGTRHILGDQRNLLDFRHEFRGFRPEIVLHMIAMSEVDAKNVMKTFKGIARRVVAISSQDVYRAYGRVTGFEPGPIDPVPISENAPLRTRLYPYRNQADHADHPLYHYEKILVERAILGIPELPGTILRYPMVYGPRDRQHRLFPYLKRMNDGRPAVLIGDDQSRWRWTKGYAENVAAATTLAVGDDRASGQVYNVGEAEALPEIEWVRAIGSAAGWDGEVVVVPAAHLPEGLTLALNTDQHLVTDTGRIREELQYEEVVTREEALVRTVTWERVHPPVQIDSRRFDYAAEDAILAGLKWSRQLPRYPNSE